MTRNGAATNLCGDPLAVVLVKLGRLVDRRVHAALRGCGISTTEYLALSYISGHPDTSRAALGRDIQLSPQAAGGIAHKLVEKKLVAKSTFGPGAPVKLSATSKGSRLLQQADVALEALTAEILRLFKAAHMTFVDGAVRHILIKFDRETDASASTAHRSIRPSQRIADRQGA